ncbi:MAG: hypothetical protein MUQ10_11180 [Anaerolineae bacterium]|nr:hypothetical protein [Anaerolineae bacterium]
MKLNHMSILKRAWRILWSYRVLWVFGIILALTAGGGSGGSSGGGSGSYGSYGDRDFRFDAAPEIQRELGEMGEALGEFFEQMFTRGIVPAGIIALVAGLACLVLVLIVVSTIARHVSENALIKLVDDYEETGEQHSLKEGIKIGWSQAAFRQWLISLVITLPIVIAILVALVLSVTPALAWITGNTTAGIFGTVAAVGLFFLVILAAIVVGTVAGLVEKLAFRAAALEDLGVFPSIGRGIQLFRENLKDVGLMWLIMFGLGLAYTVLMIPVVLLTLAVAVLVGGLVLVGVSGLAGLFLSQLTRWIVGGIIGGGAFFLVLIVPLTFIGGLSEVYKSSVWTLAFRELTAIAALTEDSESDTGTDSETVESEAAPDVRATGPADPIE